MPIKTKVCLQVLAEPLQRLDRNDKPYLVVRGLYAESNAQGHVSGRRMSVTIHGSYVEDCSSLQPGDYLRVYGRCRMIEGAFLGNDFARCEHRSIAFFPLPLEEVPKEELVPEVAFLGERNRSAKRAKRAAAMAARKKGMSK
jgi:hypothetical protein